MSGFFSPLRYPGGKGGLSKLIGRIIALNKLKDPCYAEPYAGGAGAALALLYSEKVSNIFINDLDPCVYAFWKSVVSNTASFLRLLDEVPLTIEEWRRQREIYKNPKKHSFLRLGFAAFYLNRCNRSGILVSGGPIGGFAQQGKWKLDARFNREDLRERIEKIARYKDRIFVSGVDAIVFLKSVIEPLAAKADAFVYLDPPYYVKGGLLYLNAYDVFDHKAMAAYLRKPRKFKWLLSYDNVAEVRDLYRAFEQVEFDLAYTAYARRSGRELLIHNKHLALPSSIGPWISRRSYVHCPEARIAPSEA